MLTDTMQAGTPQQLAPITVGPGESSSVWEPFSRCRFRVFFVSVVDLSLSLGILVSATEGQFKLRNYIV